MNNHPMAERIADQVLVALMNRKIVTYAQCEDILQDVVEDVIEKELDQLLGDNAAAAYLDRIQLALRALTGRNEMEQMVDQNRRGMGLPPQCIFCDCAPDQHKDYVPPTPAGA